jgi:alkanesulfonate monooxygenase SsuD/methylene tetrahydromethanopterin reductase-like flavin-dependent oxidoreductase (luciferase family)
MAPPLSPDHSRPVTCNHALRQQQGCQRSKVPTSRAGIQSSTRRHSDCAGGCTAAERLARFDLLEETVEACLQMWDGDQGSERAFDGEHVRLGRALNLPQSLSRPHPPILIAGSGEKRTLPLVARYADACNIRPSPDIPRQLDLLRSLCDREGRDYDAIEKTAPFRFDVGKDGSKAGDVVEQLRWLAGMGIETVFGWVVGVDQITPIEVMAREVIPAVAEFDSAT